MTKVLQVTNVNEALYDGILYLLNDGEEEQSRNGSVIVAPGLVVTEYLNPVQRVVFSPTRDANPFFHLMEALWMLAGHNDVAWPRYFNKRFGEYSDDGQTVSGAYGYRWRHHFGHNQLEALVTELKYNPTSRRAVLQMWDGQSDVRSAIMGSKDVPCNTNAYFDLRGGELNMTVCCRSNDIIWGAYGANAVHFSILQEFLARVLQMPMGVYRQVSNNYHAYTDVYNKDKLRTIATEGVQYDFYKIPGPGRIKPYPLMSVPVDIWLKELHRFFNDPNGMLPFQDPFFSEVAQPMYWAWNERKEGRSSGMPFAAMIRADDWRIACSQWIDRREAAKHAKATA